MSVRNGSDIGFRNKTIHPTIEELFREEVPELSPNLIHESYDSCDHYLKTQFELLREELVRPLSDDLKNLRQKLDTNGDNKENQSMNNKSKVFTQKKKTLKEEIETEMTSNVYFDIKLIEVYVNQNHGILLRFAFDYESLTLIDLIDCPRLMDGSLLVLSSDNFNESLIIGVVVDSRINQTDEKTNEKLWDFGLRVDLNTRDCNELFEFCLKPNTKYIAIESLTYFEGMVYSLSKLQKMSDNFPLKRYIVDTKNDTQYPPYLTDEAQYDMTCIAAKKLEPESETSNSNPKPHPLSSIPLVNTDNNTMSLLKKSSTFDFKQFEAFYTALTQQFAIIQGPPGTGKTFVGLKIVECLLNNRNVWNPEVNNRPILIVCYKNHALDQFLEGIVKFNKNVVRIGGKCESELLEEYKIFNIQQQYKKDKQNQNQRINPLSTEPKKVIDPKLIHLDIKCYKQIRRIKNLTKNIEEIELKVRISFETVLSLETIEPFVRPKAFVKQLLAKYEETSPLQSWLCDELDIDSTKMLSDAKRSKDKKSRLPDEEFETVEKLVKMDLFELELKDKWILYLYWRERYFKAKQKELNALSKTLSEEIALLRKRRSKFQHKLCEKAEVIGLTITGAAKYTDLIEAFNPKIMIVEEAAEVLEGHVVAAMPSGLEHLILIGDHQQLRPITSVRELTEKYRLDTSLFERMVEIKMPFKQLELQHRMRPCISELLKVAHIYTNLRNHEKVQEYPDIKYTFNKNMYFIDHNHIEDSNNSREVVDKSRSNLFEAKLVIELVKYFLLHRYPEDRITVLATYNAQFRLIKSLMIEQKAVFVKEKTDNGQHMPTFGPRAPNPDAEERPELKVRVSSVDGFQGEENDIIIISFVRSSKRGSIGFLDNMNRVNVALSRARHGLYCVGNFETMAKESDMWNKIVNHLQKNNYLDNKFVIGCECTAEEHIEMPGQFELFNLQIRNGRCKCHKD